MFLLVVFRNYDIGMNDTRAVYLPFFYSLKNMSFDDVIKTHGDKDPVFYILSWIYNLFSSNEQLYFALCACPIMYSTYILIKKYSCCYAESVVLFLTVNMYYMVFTGMRHCLALAFVTMAFMYLINPVDPTKQRKIPALIMILIASMFHITALIAIPLLFSNRFRISLKGALLSIVVAIVIAYIAKSSLVGDTISLIISMSEDSTDRFSAYENEQTHLNLKSAIVGIILYLIAYWGIKRTGKLDVYRVELNSIFIGVIMLCFMIVMGEFLRLASFYLIPIIFLVPLGLKHLKVSQVFHLLFVIAFFAYFFFSLAVHSNILNYKVF